MSNSIVGRKVKVVGDVQFETPCKGFKGIIIYFSKDSANIYPIIVEFGGVSHAYNYRELRYLNNRPVVLS